MGEMLGVEEVRMGRVYFWYPRNGEKVVLRGRHPPLVLFLVASIFERENEDFPCHQTIGIAEKERRLHHKLVVTT